MTDLSWFRLTDYHVTTLQEEEKRAYLEAKRADEVMKHWGTLRRKNLHETAKKNARLEKIQGNTSINK